VHSLRTHEKSRLGALLPICGLSLGTALVQITRVTPDAYSDDLGFYGVRLVGVSTYTFCAVMICFAVIWLVNTALNRAKRQRRR
jgi:hypothetical protein